jgi:TPR repeat protein
LLGFGICAAVMIASFQYARGTRQDSLARTTTSPNRVAQSGAAQAQAQASVTQPISPSASVPQPPAANLNVSEPVVLQTVPVTAPIRSPQWQSSQTARAPSTNLMTRRTSLVSAAPEPAKAEQPLAANQAAVASPPADSKAHSSFEQLQHSKKLPATPQQLWSSFQAGNMKAAVALADLYIRGEGVPVNCEQARILLQVASKKNNAEASKKLEELDQGGCPANSE